MATPNREEIKADEMKMTLITKGMNIPGNIGTPDITATGKAMENPVINAKTPDRIDIAR